MSFPLTHIFEPCSKTIVPKDPNSNSTTPPEFLEFFNPELVTPVSSTQDILVVSSHCNSPYLVSIKPGSYIGDDSWAEQYYARAVYSEVSHQFMKMVTEASGYENDADWTGLEHEYLEDQGYRRGETFIWSCEECIMGSVCEVALWKRDVQIETEGATDEAGRMNETRRTDGTERGGRGRGRMGRRVGFAAMFPGLQEWTPAAE